MWHPDTREQVFEAVRSGDAESIRTLLRDVPDAADADGSGTEDAFAFLEEQADQAETLGSLDTLTDARGFNPVDLVCEAVTAARAAGTVPTHLTRVALELLAAKGGFAGEATLRLLYPPEECARFLPFARAVARFRRTIGLFGMAAFGFADLGRKTVLSTQGWAVRRLYGVASIIHGDMLSAHIADVCADLHPAFLDLLRGSGRTPFRRFVETMAARHDLMNSIRDNHAHRFLTTVCNTPRFEREVLRHARAEGRQGAGEAALRRLIHHRVLLVDDQDAQRLKTAGRLIARGFRVQEARNGKEALAWFDTGAGAVDLVLSDFGMPEMDGFNLAAHLRRRDADLPIIIHTTPPIHPDLRREANRLDLRLIAKFDDALLWATIREALEADLPGDRAGA